MSSTVFWRRGVLERVALAMFRFLQRGEFPGEHFSGFCSSGVRQVLRAPQETVFFLRWRYSRDMKSTTLVLISCCFVHFISRRAKSK
jgi:hypothetical protein